MSLRALAAGLFGAVLVAAPAPRAAAQVERIVPAHDPADALMKKMLDALKADAYDLYVEGATPRLRAHGRAEFAPLRARFGALLRDGYKTTVLGSLRKPGRTVALWKLEPADGPEDFEVRLTLEDGRVDAFSIE
jgi:hypothetical protein